MLITGQGHRSGLRGPVLSTAVREVLTEEYEVSPVLCSLVKNEGGQLYQLTTFPLHHRSPSA